MADIKLNNGRILIIATALLWGLAGVCVKSIPWSSMSIMSVRCAIGIIMLGLYNRDFKIHLNKKTLQAALLVSSTGILYMMSIKLTTAATAIVLQYIAPVFVLLFNIFFKNVKPKIFEIVIVITVFGGCVLSFADELNASAVLGNLLGLASGLTFAGQIIVFSDKSINSAHSMYLSNIIGFVTCLPFMFFDKNMAFSPEILFWVLFLGIFQYGLANICYVKGCKTVSSIECSLLLTIEPIFNPIPVLVVTGEKMGTLALLGFIVVISGVTAYSVFPVLMQKKFKKSNI